MMWSNLAIPAWLLFAWVAVTVINARSWPLWQKLLVWVVTTYTYSLVVITVTHGINAREAVAFVLTPARLPWLALYWFCITKICKTLWKPGYQIAAWFTQALGVSMAMEGLFGRGAYHESLIVLFVVSGFIASRAISAEVHYWMTSASRALAVATLGGAFIGIFTVSLYDWYMVGGFQSHAWTAVGLVGMLSLPPTVWRRLFQEVL